MPDFMAQYLAAVEAHREAFRALLVDTPTDETENRLREALAPIWNPRLPIPDPAPRPAFAVDGSDAIRGFANGTFFVISQALLAGPEFETSAVNVALQRDTLSSDSQERLRGLLTRALEVRLALEHVGRCRGAALYLDGSLYAQLGHLIYPYEAAAQANVPLQLLEHYLDLIETARALDVRLIALSKTTRSHLLAHALLAAGQPTPADPAPYDANLPSDGEILARWTQGTGYTSPILVGWEAFGDRAQVLLQAPERLVENFARAGADRQRAAQALARLRGLPAVWAAYVRLDGSDDCLRVEFLADEVLPEPPRLTDCRLQMADAALGIGRLAGVVADHTTPRLYNTGLYVVDRLVRLSRSTVDEKYLPLLQEILDVPLRLNRSERRFHSFG